METTRLLRTVAIPMSARHGHAAKRYIRAIVERDPHVRLGPRYRQWRTDELWERFCAEYAGLAAGPQGHVPRDILPLALARL